MADSSPFDAYEPHAEYDDRADLEEKEHDEEEEEDDDPFASVDNPSSSAASGPAFDSFSAGKELKVEEETPQSVWEKERTQLLAERSQKAAADKQSNLSTAKEELSKFYADQDARLEKTKKINRADEKNFRSDTAAIFANGTKWEKVNRMVNVAPKVGEKPGTSRVERYRKLLLQLKVEKPKAK